MSDDTTPAVEVIEIADLRPCPPREGPWPERVTARCVCCNDRMEAFIEQRATKHNDCEYTIPVEDHAQLLARSASAVGLDGLGGWLLDSDPKRGVSWVCRTCARSALDYGDPAVANAVAMWMRWSKIEVIDRIPRNEPQSKRWRWGAKR